jgi:hypothetical protein
MKLCKIFHTSPDYLLDMTDVELPVDELAVENFSSDELELISAYRKLNFSKKERAIGFIIGLKDN